MSEEYNNAAEIPSEELKAWAETLTVAEVEEIDSLLKVYQYSGTTAPELLLLNQKGVEALKALTQLKKEPELIIDGYSEMSGPERPRAVMDKKIELSQQLEKSLEQARDKLYDYEDEEIAQFEQEAETLFASPIEYKEAA